MPRRRGGRGRAKPTENADNNTILYIAGGLAGVVAVGAVAGLCITMWDKRKAAIEASTEGVGARYVPAEIKERVETVTAALVQTKQRVDTPETIALRKECDSIDFDKEDPASRLVLAQFVRFRADNVDNLNTKAECQLAHKILDYDLTNSSDEMIGEWIRTKYRTAFLAKDVVELNRLRRKIKTMDPPTTEVSEMAHTYFLQFAFKLACFFGDWDEVAKYGEMVAPLKSVIQNPRTGRKDALPLMMGYQSLARNEPDQFPNYYILYLRFNMFKTRFDTRFQSKLQFIKWGMVSARTKYAQGMAQIPQLQADLDAKKGEDWKQLKMKNQAVWVFGAICQMKLTAIEDEPCVLTGPFNDCEMCLVGLMFVDVGGGRVMRVEITCQLERGEWTPKNTEEKKKGSWSWTGQLIYERFLQHPRTMSWQMISQEAHDIEMALEDNVM